MKIKVSEATNIQLDWLVALTEGYTGWDGECFTRYVDDYPGAFFLKDWQPTTDWSQGGPIIERENIGTGRPFYGSLEWFGRVTTLENDTVCYGPTPLVAALRCFVASKLGDEVDIPEELK